MEEQLVCLACGVFLREPYVKCVKCSDPYRSLCLQCFAKGAEYGDHKNDHPYVICRINFTLFDPDWMASEELKLVNAISECGLGNWVDIAQCVGTKNKAECEEHYFKYYINEPEPSLPVPSKPEVVSQIHPAPVSCTKFSQDPPRPIVGSTMYHEMAGYMPARGDFSVEYDDFAELDIKDLDFTQEDDGVSHDLQRAVLSIYQSRLKERARRKELVMSYGLINTRRTQEDWLRYSILGRPILDRMKTLMHLLAPEDFDCFMEGLLLEEKTKQRIKLLQECRENGITNLKSIDTYVKLKKKRDERKKSHSALDEVLSQIKDEASSQQFFRRQVLRENRQGFPDGTSPVRQGAAPLPIHGLPGYESLTPKEKELCEVLRLTPKSFLQHKGILLNEYRKFGRLRLATARSVLKIDVNKTRKIYDLLLEEGAITKE